MRVKPPVPVHVKPVAFAIDNTVAPPVELVNAMLPEPKEMPRVFELLELKTPVLKVNPARSRVPRVKVIVLIAPPRVIASARVTVMPTPSIVEALSALPTLVMVPDARCEVVTPV